ncbi:MAG: lysyl oxidase family protein [Actinomycetota bacterium]|nr:lysyl oxidase family protein [Actinomycetota bacterium]
MTRKAIGMIATAAVALGATLAPSGMQPTKASRRDAHPLVARLSPGDHVFWRGPESADTHRYRFALEGRGARLRVAADGPWVGGFVRGRLIAPGGFRRSFTSWDEVFVRNPRPGTWRIVVDNGFGSVYRMRAKLETRRDLAWPHRPMWLKPNLRSMPPFDIRFFNPITYEGRTVTCHADEMVEEGGRRCLRLSVGPENVGAGAFELYLTPLVEATAGEATVVQHIMHSSNERMRLREAGTYEYHKTHRHYHYAGFASLKLLKVVDERRGELEMAGTGRKLGFCTADVIMTQFHRFAQDPRNSARSDCTATDGASIGLSRGWTDIYDGGTSGNYVEFGDNEDGLYVVRSGFDVRDMVDETNERDNFAYALIEVTGNRVKLLERGYGRDPWDPRKRVVRPWWRD